MPCELWFLRFWIPLAHQRAPDGASGAIPVGGLTTSSPTALKEAALPALCVRQLPAAHIVEEMRRCGAAALRGRYQKLHACWCYCRLRRRRHACLPRVALSICSTRSMDRRGFAIGENEHTCTSFIATSHQQAYTHTHAHACKRTRTQTRMHASVHTLTSLHANVSYKRTRASAQSVLKRSQQTQQTQHAL